MSSEQGGAPGLGVGEGVLQGAYLGGGCGGDTVPANTWSTHHPIQPPARPSNLPPLSHATAVPCHLHPTQLPAQSTSHPVLPSSLPTIVPSQPAAISYRHPSPPRCCLVTVLILPPSQPSTVLSCHTTLSQSYPSPPSCHPPCRRPIPPSSHPATSPHLGSLSPSQLLVPIPAPVCPAGAGQRDMPPITCISILCHQALPRGVPLSPSSPHAITAIHLPVSPHVLRPVLACVPAGRGGLAVPPGPAVPPSCPRWWGGALFPAPPRPRPPPTSALDFNRVSKHFLRGEDEEGPVGVGWGGHGDPPPGTRLGREPACSLDGINILKTNNPPQPLPPASVSPASVSPASARGWSQGLGFVLETFYWALAPRARGEGWGWPWGHQSSTLRGAGRSQRWGLQPQPPPVQRDPAGQQCRPSEQQEPCGERWHEEAGVGKDGGHATQTSTLMPPPH